MASTNGKKPCVTAPAERSYIEIRGARQNNLKGFDLDGQNQHLAGKVTPPLNWFIQSAKRVPIHQESVFPGSLFPFLLF